MPNIKFNYLYRDGGNYKTFGSVIFANPDNVEIDAIANAIQSRLIDACWFYAEEWKLPNLRPTGLQDTDPTWHEFESVEYTQQPANTVGGIIPLIENFALPIV